MRSGHPESLREDQANNHSADVVPARSQQPWIQAAEAVVDWYGAMFKLAFGFGRLNVTREPRGMTMPAAMPQVEQPESPPPLAPLHPVPNPPVQLRPKRRKSPSVAKRRSRSAKASSGRRGRRAA
jgi:hypothetical protein